jgi:hypothetical protein
VDGKSPASLENAVEALLLVYTLLAVAAAAAAAAAADGLYVVVGVAVAHAVQETDYGNLVAADAFCTALPNCSRRL